MHLFEPLLNAYEVIGTYFFGLFLKQNERETFIQEGKTYVHPPLCIYAMVETKGRKPKACASILLWMTGLRNTSPCCVKLKQHSRAQQPDKLDRTYDLFWSMAHNVCDNSPPPSPSHQEI